MKLKKKLQLKLKKRIKRRENYNWIDALPFVLKKILYDYLVKEQNTLYDFMAFFTTQKLEYEQSKTNLLQKKNLQTKKGLKQNDFVINNFDNIYGNEEEFFNWIHKYCSPSQQSLQESFRSFTHQIIFYEGNLLVYQLQSKKWKLFNNISDEEFIIQLDFKNLNENSDLIERSISTILFYFYI